jgi:flagellar protein FlbD
MITLHKLNGAEVVINAELIEHMEPGPQTTICLATGNKFLVTESAGEITEKVVQYRRRVNAESAAVNPIRGYTRE